jgi:hypothetical protein
MSVFERPGLFTPAAGIARVGAFAHESDETTAPFAGHRARCRSRCCRSRHLSLASAGLTGIVGARAPARAGVVGAGLAVTFCPAPS